jgi:hypothetical protein
LVLSGRGFGTNNDGAFAQFDTERACGCILEALEMPAEMAPPRTDLPGPELARVVRYFEGSGVPPALLLSPISPSAWKRNSRKFAVAISSAKPQSYAIRDGESHI